MGCSNIIIRKPHEYFDPTGFDALMPKPRIDRGQSRMLPPEVVERLLSIKEANPKLSVKLVI